MTHAETFKALHIKSDPIVLFNIWDAGTAKIVQSTGAKAIATGSFPVAVANGFADGQNIPLSLMLENLMRIIDAVELPVSCDIEGGYGVDTTTVADTVTQVVKAGAIGFNSKTKLWAVKVCTLSISKNCVLLQREKQPTRPDQTSL